MNDLTINLYLVPLYVFKIEFNIIEFYRLGDFYQDALL